MSDKKTNSVEVPVVNPLAFPQQTVTPDGSPTAPIPGMTLRDYFAGQILAGLYSNPNVNIMMSDDQIVKECYGLADAMLKARL